MGDHHALRTEHAEQGGSSDATSRVMITKAYSKLGCGLNTALGEAPETLEHYSASEMLPEQDS